MKLILNQYAYVPVYSALPPTEPQWLSAFAHDPTTELITRGDKLYAHFKWDRRTNYKENVANTLGGWERPQMFAVMQGALAVAATVEGGKPEKIKKMCEEYSLRVRKLEEEEKSEEDRRDISNEETQRVLGEIKVLEIIIQVIGNVVGLDP